MSGQDIIVMGASSGGIETLLEIVSQLPRDLPAAVFVVLHVSPRGTTKFPEILTRAGSLPAAHPIDNEPIRPGLIYVAPPDFHLLLRNGKIRLVRGPKENNARPAIDATFRTAARSYGPRVIGVVLWGLSMRGRQDWQRSKNAVVWLSCKILTMPYFPICPEVP